VTWDNTTSTPTDGYSTVPQFRTILYQATKMTKEHSLCWNHETPPNLSA